ncbi:intradiol ring-cleavage dioxygenase [Microbacterium aurantiacum]|uniref:Intradiol ring-cleavage dioxygenase n=1 Tax=Microbacterium aurantiacum TaxID=162393 RepID=A0ABT8FNP3_9MICO|nr:intradiol ring-cleavage dioxygenase [Microbacterium aurantiacum]MDN4462946.1 intradiol ring-cleavage dioxygenase [Microbacterium aurantiacum]
MTRFPDPDVTPDGPAYEGRLLARPDDEVVDQGIGFDLGTLVSRRGILGIVGLGAGAVALAACSPLATSAATPSASATPTTTGTPTLTATASASAALPAGEIPDETAGPYLGDGSNGPDVLEQSGIIRRDLRTSLGGTAVVEGVPAEVTLRITDMASGDAPFAGVAVYAWHCDAQGRYSMYSDGVEGETWLRGVQVADSDGQVTFTTIVPGCYAGRWPHIHFEVYPDAASITDAGNAIATSQLALPQAMLESVYALPAYDGSARNLSGVSLASDNVFGEDGGALQMATVTGDASAGYAASLVVRVDTATTPSAGAAPGRP